MAVEDVNLAVGSRDIEALVVRREGGGDHGRFHGVPEDIGVRPGVHQRGDAVPLGDEILIVGCEGDVLAGCYFFVGCSID